MSGGEYLSHRDPGDEGPAPPSWTCPRCKEVYSLEFPGHLVGAAPYCTTCALREKKYHWALEQFYRVKLDLPEPPPDPRLVETLRALLARPKSPEERTRQEHYHARKRQEQAKQLAALHSGGS